MVDEKWTSFEGVCIPMDEYEVVQVRYDSDGTFIELEGENHKILMRFDYPDAVRICDEGRRIKTYHEAVGLQEYRENFRGNPLFIVEHSSFSKWVEEESGGMYSDFTHYAIVTLNDIVDVISTSVPEVERILLSEAN